MKGDFNINLLSGSSLMLDNKHYDSFSQAPTLDKQYMDLCFSHSLHQLAAEPTRTAERTKTLTNHVLTNSAE